MNSRQFCMIREVILREVVRKTCVLAYNILEIGKIMYGHMSLSVQDSESQFSVVMNPNKSCLLPEPAVVQHS